VENKYLLDGACGDTCPTGYYPWAETWTCMPCSYYNALTCEVNAETNIVESLTCMTDYALEDNTCVSMCSAKNF